MPRHALPSSRPVARGTSPPRSREPAPSPAQSRCSRSLLPGSQANTPDTRSCTGTAILPDRQRPPMRRVRRAGGLQAVMSPDIGIPCQLVALHPLDMTIDKDRVRALLVPDGDAGAPIIFAVAQPAGIDSRNPFGVIAAFAIIQRAVMRPEVDPFHDHQSISRLGELRQVAWVGPPLREEVVH